jgi:hypothetical protein
MRLWAISLLVALAIPLSAANLVVNGDFTLNCNGWSTSNTDGSFCQNGSGGLGAGNPGGFAVLNNYPGVVPTMSQTISGLVVGDTYQLTWDMESAYHCCGSSSIPGAGATFDGNLFAFVVLNSQGWTSYSETFTYTGASNVLSFMAQMNGTDTDAGFDNIVLTDVQSPVPEPSTLAMMGSAVLGLAGLVRRKTNI